jgi:hypothetical protein
MNFFKNKIMLISELKKLAYVRGNSITIYVNDGTVINWLNCPSVVINKNTKRTLFDEALNGFNKSQIPQFKYKLSNDEILIIRSHTRDYIYQISSKLVKMNKYFYHPQDIKKIYEKN